MKNKKGFTLIELIVVIVIIGILAAIAVPRFMGAQDRAKIGACEADVNSYRQALGLYEIDHATFAIVAADLAALKPLLIDPDGNAYMTLPDGANWSASTFTGDATTYTITATAKDNASTVVTGTPEGVTH